MLFYILFILKYSEVIPGKILPRSKKIFWMSDLKNQIASKIEAIKILLRPEKYSGC